LVLVLIGLFTACKRKLSSEDVERELKTAMLHQLNKGLNSDSTKVKFEVLKVNYFEDKQFYECEFNVRMKTAALDTTGIMLARVSKDFTVVRRKM